MADADIVDEVEIKQEFIYVEEYFPLDLHEEVVIAEPYEAEEVVIEEQVVDNEEIIDATNSILPDYDPLCSNDPLVPNDPLDPTQWAQEEIIIDSTGCYVKEEQTHIYECYKCAKRFNFKDKLFKHMKLHHARGDDVMVERDGKRIWTCTQCDKTFISRKGSIIHQRTHTGERPYSCSVCQKRFIDSSTLMKHQVIHQAVRPFTCVICRRGFNQKVALQRHERTHGQMQPTYKCKFCPKTFLVASSLQAHEKIHSGIKPYTCRYCSSRFHTSTAQRQHERVHTNERPYACNYCPKAFKDSGTLFKHQVIHSGIKPFVCPLCSQGFTQKVALRKHIRSHVTRSPETICEICYTQFFNKDDLSSHIEEHIEQHPNLSHVKNMATSSAKGKSDMTPSQNQRSQEQSDLSDLATLCDVAISTAGDMAHSYPCLHCGMSFRKKKSLDNHLSIHRTNCKYCDRPFPDKESLESHERRLCADASPPRVVVPSPQALTGSPSSDREGLSPTPGSYGGGQSPKNAKRFFYCERCNKTFSSRNGYIIHQRSHTGERPYPCRWCDKAFGDSATRHKHERIHTGERPFKCTRCPRAFNQRAALRAHQVTHTVDRAFLCKYCPSSFPYFATLKRHQQACHSQLVCPLCFTSTNDPKKLHDHIKNRHASDPNLACSLCDSGIFTDLDEYCDHMLWHGKQQQPSGGASSPIQPTTPTKTSAKNHSLASSSKRRPASSRKRNSGLIDSVQPSESHTPEDHLPKEEKLIEEPIEQSIVTEDFPIIESQFACDMCGLLYTDKEQLREHIPVHI